PKLVSRIPRLGLAPRTDPPLLLGTSAVDRRPAAGGSPCRGFGSTISQGTRHPRRGRHLSLGHHVPFAALRRSRRRYRRRRGRAGPAPRPVVAMARTAARTTAGALPRLRLAGGDAGVAARHRRSTSTRLWSRPL